MNTKILAFAGSARLGSFNKKVVKIAADGAKAAGAEVTYIDFRDLPMPLFDEDLEAEKGIPENVFKFKDLLIANDGFLISCPEYNSSITPLLKNAIDWASRPDPRPEMAGVSCYRDKVAVIMSASPGGLGGMRGLVHVRAILGNIGVIVLPDERAVSNADQAFDDSDKFKDSKLQAKIEALGAKLATFIEKTK